MLKDGSGGRSASERTVRSDEDMDISVVVPVNARSDLSTVRRLLADVFEYQGPHRVETVVLVNNFDDGQIPAEVIELRKLGASVIAIPSTRKAGEAIVFSARMAGVRAARADWVVNFDADCRIPNATTLLNWYVEQFRAGAMAAYTPVEHYDYENAVSVRCALAIHRSSRWVKRVILRIPTTRGSNYAVHRASMLDLYDRGLLADDLNVGPTIKRLVGPVAYGAGRDLTVLTSGRMYRRGWRGLPGYYLYRLRYNLRVLPVRAGVAQFTGRDRDSIGRYDYRATQRDRADPPV